MWSASRMCNGSVTSAAPRRIKRCGPNECGSPMRWGIQSRSRLYSLASRAVMSVPDLFPASMTSTASASPTIRRLRSGKKCTRDIVSGSYSESMPPPAFRISFAKPRLLLGYSTSSSSPEPGSASVWSPVASAALCAQVSTPSASPLTIEMG